MALPFHPQLAALLADEGWTELTPVQSAAQPVLQSGHHALIMAPTGHGKTESAILPILDRLLHERDALHAKGASWPKGIKTIYVTPLRALNRDLTGRLEGWAQALGFRLESRHGDTSQAQRAKQSRNPPDLLITTPETLQLLLYGDKLRQHLATVRFVVLDEIHDLLISERGAQLAVALERLEEVIASTPEARELTSKERVAPKNSPVAAKGMFQRIGLSATVPDADLVCRFLVGPGRTCEQVRIEARKHIELHVTSPRVIDDDERVAAELSIPKTLASQIRVVRKTVAEHERVIVFQNTRDGAEMMASRIALLEDEEGVPPSMGLHHGSLSADHRRDIEEAFKAGELKALIATSSLELGIDVGAIDHILQVHSPRSVARMVQRLGRAGHQLGATSRGTLIAHGPEDILECMAVCQLALEGAYEPISYRDTPLIVLVNQLIALTNEYAAFEREWAYELFTRSAPFADLDPDMFMATWDALLELKSVFPSEERPRAFGRSGRTRKHFLDHIGMIPDERTYRVVNEATKRSIGSVDDSFVAATLHPGASLVMAGRTWTVLEIQAEEERVRVAPAKDLGAVPNWSGSMMPVSYELAQRVAQLRPLILTDAELPCDQDARDKAAQPFLEQQRMGLKIPTDKVVTLEPNGRELILNIPLGTRGNEGLGYLTRALLEQRLGKAVGLQTDAYRIKFSVAGGLRPSYLEQAWDTLRPDSLDLVLGFILRESPLIKHHLVHVAKHFGALPKDLDPNRFSKTKLMDLLNNPAMGEETLARLMYDRFDLTAVANFLAAYHDGEIELLEQELGPVSILGDEEQQALLQPVPTEALLQAVRERIEGSDVMLVCIQCQHVLHTQAGIMDERPHCRRCSSKMFVPLRPWQEDRIRLLKLQKLNKEEELERTRLIRGAQLMMNFGKDAALLLMGRGIGPDTAGRLLRNGIQRDDPRFWRQILEAEIQYARTNAFWKRGP